MGDHLCPRLWDISQIYMKRDKALSQSQGTAIAPRTMIIRDRDLIKAKG